MDELDLKLQIIATTKVSDVGISYQWYSKEKIKNTDIIQWHKIRSVSVFKRDLFSYDLICLQLELIHGMLVEVDEEDLNWKELTELLPKYLPSCKKFEEWFNETAFPAFETNLQIIYKR